MAEQLKPLVEHGHGENLLGDPASRHAFTSRYEARELLGQGGMGDVRLYRDTLVGREIALKTIRLDQPNSAELRARFLREARVQGRLEHPAIVPLYDLGLDANGNEYFTMKRITGRTLADILKGLREEDPRTKTHFARNKLLALFTQVCLAVEYAHSRGVVHRDLKPTNIMIGDFGEVYVLDWGLARLLEKASGYGLHEQAAPPTEQGQMLGTPGYMAPEQVTHADRVDELADVYALGAILFEILALCPLHAGEHGAERIRTTFVGVDARPSVRRPESESPPELDPVCVRATHIDRKARCTTAREIAEAVENFLAGDRDLEARRALSKKHAAAAAEAKEEALLGGPESNLARVRALREAGRAIGLDPTSPQAAGIVLTLLRIPPQQIPDEVHDELEAATARTSGAMARYGTFVGLSYAGLGLLTIWLGLRSWIGLALLLVPLTLSTILCFILGWFSSRIYFKWGRHVIAVLLYLAIVAGSGIAGAIVFMPAFACSATTALVVSALNARQRWIYFAMGLASIVVPFALEWMGLLPRSYVFGESGMTIVPVVADLHREIPMRIYSIMLCLGAMGGCGFAIKTMGVVSKLRQRAALQSWQLRQLAPASE